MRSVETLLSKAKMPYLGFQIFSSILLNSPFELIKSIVSNFFNRRNDLYVLSDSELKIYTT